MTHEVGRAGKRRGRRSGPPVGPTLVLHGYPDGHHDLSLDAGAPAPLATALNAATTYAVQIGNGVWTCEWSIPLSAAGVRPQPGLTLGFNLGARRLETDDWLVWTGTGHENWRLDGAGRIVLKP